MDMDIVVCRRVWGSCTLGQLLAGALDILADIQYIVLMLMPVICTAHYTTRRIDKETNAGRGKQLLAV